MIEESPCVQISPTERKKLGEIVANATLKLGYTNTGTYEFLMTEDHHFYFMEMNTRLQVEHTITEEVTGIELVKAQLMVADGQELPFTQADVAVKGHALECRLNAEDPSHNFAPRPGRINNLFFPAGSLGVRIDSGVAQGSFISPFYDSMIAKVIVHLNDRNTVIAKMNRILGELKINGVVTNQTFLKYLINTAEFNSGQYSTNFIENQVLTNKEGFHVAESV